MLQKLLDDHRLLKVHATALKTLLGQPAPPEAQQLADARWALGSCVMQHLAFEARHLYTHLEQDERAEVRAVGLRFQADLSRTFDPYVEHVRSWTPEDVAADWDGYRHATIRLIDTMIDRILREEAELFPFVRLRGIDTQRTAPTTANWTRDAFAVKDAINGR